MGEQQLKTAAVEIRCFMNLYIDMRWFLWWNAETSRQNWGELFLPGLDLSVRVQTARSRRTNQLFRTENVSVGTVRSLGMEQD
jgi:hypothetical protein